MMTDTILFDFFGTLAKYSSDRTQLTSSKTHDFFTHNVFPIEYNVFKTEWNISFSKLEQRSTVTQLEFSMHDVLSEFLSHHGKEIYPDSLKDAFLDVYINEWSSHIEPFPHLDKLLASLSSDYKLGVVSNTHRVGLVPRLMEQFGITDYFSSVVTSIDHGRPKPHDSIYTVALADINANAQHTIFVGDSIEHDYVGPRKLGMYSVLIANEAPEGVPPEHVISEVNELISALPIKK